MTTMTTAERNEMTKLINKLLPTPSAALSVSGRIYTYAYKNGDLDALRCFARFPQFSEKSVLVERTIRVLRQAGIDEVAPFLTEDHVNANFLIINLLSASEFDMNNTEYKTIVPLATLHAEHVDLIADLWINRNVRTPEEILSIISEVGDVKKPLVSGVL